MAGTILLYYNYTPIENPKEIMAWQRQLCTRLKLKGRVIIGTEGINGTVGGENPAVEEYKKEFLAHPLFTTTDIKESDGCADDFPRLSIRVRNEVVALGLDTKKVQPSGPETHLSPEQVHELLTESPDDLVVLDARNDYESRIGRFKNAITPDITRFRDFPDYVDKHADELKDKTVLMYCTGGIRCERASTYVQNKNIAKKVYQITGGICRYIEKYPDGFFRGKNYVFDERIAVKVNDDILSNCDLCSSASDEYANCMNALCNKHFIACSACRTSYDTCCSEKCFSLLSSGAVKRRPTK
ncbi:MAG: rhodanese-related sulfurtransferase [Candidatus Dependentiae bacterium]|jgi:predicted sulfurtransferase